MNWIFDNLQIVLTVAAALAYWLTQRAASKSDKQAKGRPGAERQATPDVEDFDLTRKIQEEIRRRIAERRGEMSEPPQGQPFDKAQGRSMERPPEPEQFERYREPEPPPPLQPVPVEPPSPVMSPMGVPESDLERQLEEARERAALTAEKRKQASVKLSQALRSSEAAAAGIRAPKMPSLGWQMTTGGQGGSNRTLRRALLSPSTVRQAIVLREVLGPPVGLRD